MNHDLRLRDTIPNLLWAIGSTIFFFAFAILLISALFFFSGHAISPVILMASFLISIAYCIFLVSRLFPDSSIQLKGYGAIAFIALMLLSIGIAAAFYDSSWDGQVYHQNAIDHLANRWNPFRSVIGGIWEDHYAKGPWIDAASLYQTIGHIEASKAFNIAFIIGSWLLSIKALSLIERLKPVQIYFISFLAAFNPVSIYQSLSFYVDGQLSSLLVALAASLCIFIASQPKTINVLLLIPIITLLINVKFTALIYCVIILLPFSFYALWGLTRASFYKLFITSIFSVLLGLLVIGYNPYITNIQTHGHPFYPLAGKGAVDIITPQEPIALLNKNSIQQFLISLFSIPGNYHPDHYRSDQIPIAFPIATDTRAYETTDTRIGGFGLFFGWLLILSIIVSAALLVKKALSSKFFVAASLVLWLSVVANPAFWWARYVPQLWLFPLFCAIAALTLSRQRIHHFLAYSILWIALVNIVVIGYVYVQFNWGSTQMVKDVVSTLAASNTRVAIGKSDWASPLIHLQENNIPYQIVDPQKMPCSSPQRFPATFGQVVYCPEATTQ